ncbi:RNA polymerase sigma factor [Psychrobacillus vulpis]|uniref:RNA polymerase sigma factor n=1 Tax=Psychrobacillus vulpis TaxID=2325572 RepID=A0A544TW60_9BACI|nr:RNA polymerase sigma factor [Psychrobacillus vulpis]TQR21683.1 RNA polymerase sigma factor [Psychrobacillus vulpis]
MRPLVEKTPIEITEEFEMAIMPYMHDLRKYCFSLTRTKWDGEDLMQETLVKAYESWMKIPKQMAKAYLFRIASNTWIDKHRKRKIEEDMNQDLSQITQENAHTLEAFFPTIMVLLNELSAKQRAVVLFVLGFDYTIKETASLLSDSEGSIKAALHRARKKLKQVNIHDYSYDLDEENLFPYVTALSNENSEAVLRLYQKEMQEPSMHARSNQNIIHSSPIVHSFVGGITPYVLISIPKKNGGVLFIPFYQLELSALLSQIAWLKQKEFSAVA